jgi:hypothetical protein
VRLALQRKIATVMLILYAGLLATQCATFGGESQSTQYEGVEAAGPEIPPPPENFVPIRVVLLDFRNAANVSRFDVIPDGDYGEYLASPPPTEQSDNAGDNLPPESENKNAGPQKTPEPETVDSGAIAREVTETTLFGSGRFEIVPEYLFRAQMRKAQAAGQDEASAIAATAEALDVRYVLYGTLTDFEITQKRDYWKLPLWAILLIASFFIQDDDLRTFVWYTMIRIALVVPLNSSFWDYGIQWDNLDLNVDVAMDLRLVDARTGSVVYSNSESVTRVENVRNLNLMVWASNRRIKITSSNAGRQIRYVARELVRDLALEIDAGTALPATNVR